MADPKLKPEEDIIIRTMKGDLEKLGGVPVKKEEKPVPPTPPKPISPISKEAVFESPKTPPPIPIAPPSKPPVLIVPPKTIPSKEVPKTPTKPLYKAMPVWIKLGIIGLAVIVIVLSGLYGYWKIFVQNKPTPTLPTATTTVPTLPTTPTATTTIPTRFFNKLPNKSITIDLPSKTSVVLTQILNSEAKIPETLAAVKQIKMTYQGKSLTTEDFFNLMTISTSKDFLSNYENEFVFAYFSQKEGARPILILKTKNADLAKTQMANWEKTTLTSDIFSLFLTDSELPKTLQSFKSYLFIGQPVRYLNINIPFASLNYAIYDNFLVFTTSSAGMFVVLQDLTGQNVSLEYLKSLEASINQFVQ